MDYTFHTHKTEEGLLVKCYHKTRSVLLDISFWIGTLIAFPLEHWIWEKLWPFTVLTDLLGL